MAAEAEALRAAERGILAAELEQALGDGDLDHATALVIVSDVDDAEREVVLDRVRALVAREPAHAARLLARLAERFPDMADEAEAAQVAARYAADAVAGTRAAQRGARVDMVARVLAMLEEGYLSTPDWAAMEAAGRRRLAMVAPAVEGPPLPASPEPHPAAMVAWLREVVGRGLSEEVAAVEWTGAALRALDPWSQVIWPAQVAGWEAHHAGTVLGVGLELEDVEGRVVVSLPLVHGPAWEAGVHQGDVLLRLHNEGDPVDLAGLDAASVRALLAGPPGSTVAFDVRRAEGEKSFRVERAAVKVEVVTGWERRSDNGWDMWLDAPAHIAFAHIRAFRQGTDEAFDARLAPVAGEARALVLDLRGNAGGDVDAAVQIADRFVGEGVLAGLQGRDLPELPTVDPTTGDPLVPWNHAVPGHPLEGLRLVILVDHDTASAAEILAGALQELGAAHVIGERTWGKGLSQVLKVDEELGFGVQYTNLAWTLPSGRALHEGGGLVPDQVWTSTSAERYAMRALRARREAPRTHGDGTPMIYVGPVPRPELPPLSEDPMVIAALLYLRGR